MPCFLLPAEVGAFHQQYVHVPRGDPFDQGADHARLPAVSPEVSRVEQPLAAGFEQEGEAAEGAVIDRERRDREVAHHERCAGFDGPVSISVQGGAVGEDAAGEHHLARARGGVDRGLRPRVVEQADVIQVGVREQDGIRGRGVVGEQAGHGLE